MTAAFVFLSSSAVCLGFLGVVRQALQVLTFTRLLCYVRSLLDEDCCNCNMFSERDVV